MIEAAELKTLHSWLVKGGAVVPDEDITFLPREVLLSLFPELNRPFSRSLAILVERMTDTPDSAALAEFIEFWTPYAPFLFQKQASTVILDPGFSLAEVYEDEVVPDWADNPPVPIFISPSLTFDIAMELFLEFSNTLFMPYAIHNQFAQSVFTDSLYWTFALMCTDWQIGAGGRDSGKHLHAMESFVKLADVHLNTATSTDEELAALKELRKGALRWA